MNRMSRGLAVLTSLAGAAAFAADAAQPDTFAPVRFLVGEWIGKAEGQAGAGTVTRSYQVVLGGRFIEERNTSNYPPQPKNEKGEIHEHRGFISYDRVRKTLMIRQFHQESFVILYAFNAAQSGTQRLVFDSEHFENFDNSWKARETYEIASSDEFVEIFELAEPGKPFEVYSRTQFRRAR
jgi:hypothetical protein